MDTLTDEGIIAHLHDFNLKEYNRVAYNIVTEDKEVKGGLVIHERSDEPCYGGLHKYGKDEYRPTDLKHIFPDKVKILGLGVSFNKLKYNPPNNPYNTPGIQEYLEWLVSEDSPWRKSFGSGLLHTRDKKDILRGVILKDTKIDPTVFVNMLLCTHMTDKFPRIVWYELVSKGVKSSVAFLISIHFWSSDGTRFMINASNATDYYILPKTNLQRWRNKSPQDINTPKGELFYDGVTYNRRDVATIWAGDGAVSLIQHFRPRYKSDYTITQEEMIKSIVPEIEEMIKGA